MKNRLLHSIGFKIIFLYALLSIINISFVISIIFENQVELISTNTKLESERQLVTLIDSIKKLNIDMKKGTMFNIRNKSEIIKHLTGIIAPHVSTYMIFSEKGDILNKSSDTMHIPETYIKDGLRLMTIMTFTGKEYYIRIDESKKLLYCYIPLQDFQLSKTILLVQKDISGVNESLKNLYYQALYVIIVILFFHVIFALVLYRYIIHPINLLGQSSKKLLEGDLSARVQIERNDEFSALAETFNKMAESVHNNIITLADQVQKAKENRENIEHTAMRDELTGLYNRTYLLERLREETGKPRLKEDGMAFAIINNDHFHALNKVYGHQTGDIVLMETAKIIAHSCKEGDVTARFGGDEFAILSPDSTLEQIESTAEMIRSTIEEKCIVTPDGEFFVTVSIGIAYPDNSQINTNDAARSILLSAETALLLAKKQGRNRIEINR